MTCHPDNGVLRCLTCGHEQPRKAKGFYLFKPVHCNVVMEGITADQLQQEKEYWERVEAEHEYQRSVGE